MYIKSKDLSVPIGPEVAAFAAAMHAKMKMDGLHTVREWEGMPIAELKAHLAKKVRRLLENDDDSGLFLQAVVVGAFSMMIAEKSARKRAKCPDDPNTMLPLRKPKRTRLLKPICDVTKQHVVGQ